MLANVTVEVQRLRMDGAENAALLSHFMIVGAGTTKNQFPGEYGALSQCVLSFKPRAGRTGSTATQGLSIHLQSSQPRTGSRPAEPAWPRATS